MEDNIDLFAKGAFEHLNPKTAYQLIYYNDGFSYIYKQEYRNDKWETTHERILGVSDTLQVRKAFDILEMDY